jgi:segregation and condensation protein B
MTKSVEVLEVEEVEVDVETQRAELEPHEVSVVADEVRVTEEDVSATPAETEAVAEDVPQADLAAEKVASEEEEVLLTANGEVAEEVREETAMVYDVTDPAAPWLLSCVESLVFASTQPLTVARVVDVLKGERVKIEKDIVRGAFENLLAAWNDPDRSLATGFQLVEVAKGLSFRTVMDNAPFIRRFFAERPQRLTRAQLETLAIISYRQPATRGQVEEIRGVDCGSALRTLLDKNLIKVLGKSEEIGRPWIYGTTKYFLSFFALKSLHDLPPLQEVQELDAENTEKLRAILGDTSEENMIMELFDPEKQGKLISEDTEEMSEAALTDLDSAVGFANEVMKRVKNGPESQNAEGSQAIPATTEDAPAEVSP